MTKFKSNSVTCANCAVLRCEVRECCEDREA
jgi:hypothetical protein